MPQTRKPLHALSILLSCLRQKSALLFFAKRYRKKCVLKIGAVCSEFSVGSVIILRNGFKPKSEIILRAINARSASILRAIALKMKKIALSSKEKKLKTSKKLRLASKKKSLICNYTNSFHSRFPS